MMHTHPENDPHYKGLAVNGGVETQPTVNPYLQNRAKRRDFTAAEYAEQILKGNITVLSQAVTLIESQKPEHHALAQEVIEKCLPSSGKSVRIGITGAGNDHRLGANEAPPAILSVYLGEQLTTVINNLVGGVADKSSGAKGTIEVGVSSLPPLPKDFSDRNRTSPFAFTGNKFEFRAIGSSHSIAPSNIALNVAVANAIDDIATELEAAVAEGTPLNRAVHELLVRLFREHMPIVFNGNGYTEEWKKEALARGLPNMTTTVEALECYSTPGVTAVFQRHGVLSECEMTARQTILLENYAKTIAIEANLTSRIGRTAVLPVALQEQAEAAELTVRTREALGSKGALPEEKRFTALRTHTLGLAEELDALDKARHELHEVEDILPHARAARDKVLPAMNRCRQHIDALEMLVGDERWPMPTYAELLWVR